MGLSTVNVRAWDLGDCFSGLKYIHYKYLKCILIWYEIHALLYCFERRQTWLYMLSWLRCHHLYWYTLWLWTSHGRVSDPTVQWDEARIDYGHRIYLVLGLVVSDWDLIVLDWDLTPTGSGCMYCPGTSGLRLRLDSPRLGLDPDWVWMHVLSWD